MYVVIAQPAVLFGGLIFAACVAILIVLAVLIFFLLTLQKALSRCSPRNRTMAPGLVWLNIIPFFSLFWQFVTVLKISESLRNEYRDRRLEGGGDYGRAVGIAYAVISALYAGIRRTQLKDNLPLMIGCLVCGLGIFIAYWVQIAGLSRRLIRDNFRDYDDDDYNFNDDSDNPLPRRDRHDEYGDDERDERPRRSFDYEREDGQRDR